MDHPPKTINYRLPFGKLEQLPEGKLRVFVEGDTRKLDKAGTAFFRLVRFNPHLFFLPRIETMIRGRGILSIEYSSFNPGTARPVSEVIGVWNKQAKLYLPLSIELLYFLLECDKQIRQRSEPVLPPLPFTVFFEEDPAQGTASWKMLPIPQLETDVGDWADSAPESWQWLNGDCVLKQPVWDMKYLSGAVFYYSLVGDLFPRSLTRPERYHRLVTKRVGNSLQLERAIHNALPKSMHEEGKVFMQNVLLALESDLEGPKDEQEDHYPIQGILGDISVPRLANRWEYEGQSDTALHIFDSVAKFTSPGTLPWQTIARLQEKLGDEVGAFESHLRALEYDQEDSLKLLIWHLFRLEHKIMQGEELMTLGLNDKILDQIRAKIDQNAQDLQYLQFAHILFKYRNQPKAALQLVSRRFEDVWMQIMYLMIASRVACTQQDYPKVSLLCKKAIAKFNGMPGAGSEDGLIALSYFYLLNGIAHFGASGKLQDMSYLPDGFQHFTKAIDYAISVDEQYYVFIGSKWLNLLKGYSAYFPAEMQGVIRTGIEAYLDAKCMMGLELRPDDNSLATIPWYPEYLFFPKNN